MAIQVDLATSQYGVPFAGAYFRIVTASVMRQRGDAPRFSVMLDVAGYATAPQDEDTRDVDFRRYHTPLATIEAMAGDNFLAKCYSWVMSQEDMNGAVPA
jgi:hypothetical protein